MTNEGLTPQHNDLNKATERILSWISDGKILQDSARLLSYVAAALTIYRIANGDIAAILTISPILGRLVEAIGGNLLASFLERVSKSENEGLSEEKLIELIENELSDLRLTDVLTEREFHRTISRLLRQNEDKYHTLSQGITTTLDLLRQVHPSDPAPLSIIPRSARPLLTGSPLIGRDTELSWLQNTKGDRLLVGQPGIGKTFLFYQLAINGYGLFVISRDRGEITWALQEYQPSAIIVDNAHIEPELLLDIRQIRQKLGLEFDILASSWPGAKDQIADNLHLSQKTILDVVRLNDDQIVEVIKFTGITGPNSVIREIREQADGRPGLAVTLTEIYKQGDGLDVWQGDILRRTILNFDPGLKSNERTNVIIAAFSLGGERGMPHQSISQELNIPRLDLQQEASYFVAAGIIWEVDKQHLSVKPPALRYAMIREVFFKKTIKWWDIRQFLQYAPNKEEACITLIGTQARGAEIPRELLIEQLEEANTTACWMRYAGLGTEQKDWVLQHHREKIIFPSVPSLHLAPEEVIPLLLSHSVGDRRPLGPNTSHPMRLIQDWVLAAPPNTNSVIYRRKLLLQKAQEWMNENGDDDVCLRALQLVMSPKFESVELDPGLGNSAIISHGRVTIEEMHQIFGLWNEVYEVLSILNISHNWEPLRDMISEWTDPLMLIPGHEQDQEVVEVMHNVAVKILGDVIPLVHERFGILHWATTITNELDAKINVPVNEDFMLLYPVVNLTGEQAPSETVNEILEQAQQALRKKADNWSKLPPLQVATYINQIEIEAQIANVTWPRLTPFLCSLLAERVENVLSWFQTFTSTGLNYDLVIPFRKKWIEISQEENPR